MIDDFLLNRGVFPYFSSYNVTVRITEKKPVQRKEYVWCMKIPPRCSKYTIDFVDLFKDEVKTYRENFVL